MCEMFFYKSENIGRRDNEILKSVKRAFSSGLAKVGLGKKLP